MAKIKDLRAKSVDELNEQLLTLKKESFNLRFQQASGELTNTNRRRQIRRETAQIKTILYEREKTVSKE